MNHYTCNGWITASGLGAEAEAYRNLLLTLCKSGCTIPKIEVIPRGMLGIEIRYTVEGTKEQLATFRQLVNGNHT